MVRWMMIAALVALPFTARAQTVTMKRGQAVTLVMGDDDALHIAATDDVVASDFEKKGAMEFQRGDYDAALGANSLPMTADRGAGALAPVPKPGKLVLRFVRTPGKDQSLLSIQNGLSRAYVYRAKMTIGGKTQVTDVCVVPPGKIGNEYWPHPIDTLELSNFRLVPWSPGDRVVCE